MISKLDSVEEKKAVKRSYQKIEDDEDEDDDDYRSHISPHNTDSSATQLVRRFLKIDMTSMNMFLIGDNNVIDILTFLSN